METNTHRHTHMILKLRDIKNFLSCPRKQIKIHGINHLNTTSSLINKSQWFISKLACFIKYKAPVKEYRIFF